MARDLPDLNLDQRVFHPFGGSLCDRASRSKFAHAESIDCNVWMSGWRGLFGYCAHGWRMDRGCGRVLCLVNARAAVDRFPLIDQSVRSMLTLSPFATPLIGTRAMLRSSTRCGAGSWFPSVRTPSFTRRGSRGPSITGTMKTFMRSFDDLNLLRFCQHVVLWIRWDS